MSSTSTSLITTAARSSSSTANGHSHPTGSMSTSSSSSLSVTVSSSSSDQRQVAVISPQNNNSSPANPGVHQIGLSKSTMEMLLTVLPQSIANNQKNWDAANNEINAKNKALKDVELQIKKFEGERDVLQKKITVLCKNRNGIGDTIDSQKKELDMINSALKVDGAKASSLPLEIELPQRKSPSQSTSPRRDSIPHAGGLSSRDLDPKSIHSSRLTSFSAPAKENSKSSERDDAESSSKSSNHSHSHSKSQSSKDSDGVSQADETYSKSSKRKEAPKHSSQSISNSDKHRSTSTESTNAQKHNGDNPSIKRSKAASSQPDIVPEDIYIDHENDDDLPLSSLMQRGQEISQRSLFLKNFYPIGTKVFSFGREGKITGYDSKTEMFSVFLLDSNETTQLARQDIVCLPENGEEYFVRSNGASAPYFLAQVTDVEPSKNIRSSVKFTVRWNDKREIGYKRSIFKLTSLIPVNSPEILENSDLFLKGNYCNKTGNFYAVGFRFNEQVRDSLSETK